jgi:4-amino-4-deoxy-L-arabinose transferase-like glycosyltransferase
MSPRGSGRSAAALAALLVLLALFAGRLAHTALKTSYTYDEPHYLGTGVYLWRSGDYRWMEALSAHPPLAFHLAGLPWLAFDLGELPDTPGAGFELIGRPEAQLRRLRLASRLPFVVLACWGALLLFRWACDVAGPRAGMLAVFLYTFCPTILAHAPLVHSDITVTVFYLQTLYAYWRWTRRPTPGRLVVCGVSLGLALLSKLSAILLVPTLGLLILCRPMGWETGVENPPAPRGLGAGLARAARTLAPLGGIAVLVVWAGYGGSFASAPAEGEVYAHLPLPGYLRALLFDVEANAGGRRTFLLGEFSTQGWWYFFPVAFAVKTPLAALALLALASLPRRGGPAAARGFGAVVAAGTILYALVACFVLKVPLGIRYVLPLYPLLHLAVGVRLGPAGGWRGGATLVACAWLAVASLRAHPHYLSYFNEAVGGPAQGHRYLLESNLDWGQDLATLADYLQARGNPPVHLAYFGRESPASYGLRATPMTTCAPVTGLVAVSANFLYDMYALNLFAPPDPGCWRWLRDHEPVAQPGYSIVVYDISVPLGGGRRHERLSRRDPRARRRLHPHPLRSYRLAPPCGRIVPMTDRSTAVTRKARLATLDDRFDREFWARIDPNTRFAETWRLSEEVWRFAGQETSERGLSRYPGRVVRGRR